MLHSITPAISFGRYDRSWHGVCKPSFYFLNRELGSVGGRGCEWHAAHALMHPDFASLPSLPATDGPIMVRVIFTILEEYIIGGTQTTPRLPVSTTRLVISLPVPYLLPMIITNTHKRGTLWYLQIGAALLTLRALIPHPQNTPAKFCHSNIVHHFKILLCLTSIVPQ